MLSAPYGDVVSLPSSLFLVRGVDGAGVAICYRAQELKDVFLVIIGMLWRDKHENVREAAAHLLGILGPAVPLIAGQRTAVECLVDALSDPLLTVCCQRRGQGPVDT